MAACYRVISIINYFKFYYIFLILIYIETRVENKNPCDPSPCGPFSFCKIENNSPVCSCLENYFGNPPYCKPECLVNSDCRQTEICKNQKCVNPCRNEICGLRATCYVRKHIASCLCNDGFTGNPFIECTLIRRAEIQNIKRSCECGINAECKDSSLGSCKCIENYFGNPYEICRPECIINSDCPTNLACLQNKCQDPCKSLCGSLSHCVVTNHNPVCLCNPGYTGNPYDYCKIERNSKQETLYYNLLLNKNIFIYLQL